MRKTTPIPHPRSRPSLSHEIISPTVELLTENKSDGSALPWSQHNEGVRKPLHERGAPQAVVAVVGVAMNWHGAHVLNVLDGNGGEGHEVHFPVIRIKRNRHKVDRFEGDEIGVIVAKVMLDGRVSFDGLETQQLPEPIRNFYCFVALGVARAAMRLDGRSDLDAIQAILTANGRSGRVVEEFAGGADLISGRDYGNAERYRIHAGCLEFL